MGDSIELSEETKKFLDDAQAKPDVQLCSPKDFLLVHEKVQNHCKWSFQFIPFDGCPDILISAHTWVEHGSQGKGIGQRLQSLKEELAKRMKAGLLLATVDASNAPQIHVLEKTGWSEIDRFVAPTYGHTVILFSKHVTPAPNLGRFGLLLKKYGRHHPSCSTGTECTCGFEAVEKELK